jgi:HD-like signal output (HDOD) protein
MDISFGSKPKTEVGGFMSILLLYIFVGLAIFISAVSLWYWSPRESEVNPGNSTNDDIPDTTLSKDIDPSTARIDIPDQPQESAPQKENLHIIPVSPDTLYPTISDIPAEILIKIHDLTSALPKLPNAALDLLPVLACPGAGTKEVAEIVTRDQSSAARLLRWVNSSQFGLEGQIHSLHRAVTLLGLDTVRSLVLEDSIGRVAPTSSIVGLDHKTIWRHASAVSVTAKILAGSTHGLQPDIAATAGLLHNIGLLLLFTVEGGKLQSAIEVSHEAGEPLIAHEDAVIGFNHQIWGEIFVRAWKIPDVIAYGIGAHHSPMKEPFDPLAAVLWLADYMVSRMGISCPEDCFPYAQESEINELMVKVGLQPPLERYLTENLGRELLKATQYWSRKKETPESVVSITL